MTRDVLRQRLRLHPHLRLGPVILSNERGGIIPLIVVGSFFHFVMFAYCYFLPIYTTFFHSIRHNKVTRKPCKCRNYVVFMTKMLILY